MIREHTLQKFFDEHQINNVDTSTGKQTALFTKPIRKSGKHTKYLKMLILMRYQKEFSIISIDVILAEQDKCSPQTYYTNINRLLQCRMIKMIEANSSIYHRRYKITNIGLEYLYLVLGHEEHQPALFDSTKKAKLIWTSHN